MGPARGAAAAGGGEERGQGNIYSDVTFHFHEAGRWCWSRKRAARDDPAWEAAPTPSTTRARLWRAMKHARGWPLGFSPCCCHPPHWRGRGNGCSRQEPGLLHFRTSSSRQEPITPRGHPSAPWYLWNSQEAGHTVQGASREMHQLAPKTSPRDLCVLEAPSPPPSEEMGSSVPPSTEPGLVPCPALAAALAQQRPWLGRALPRYHSVFGADLDFLYNVTLMPLSPALNAILAQAKQD